MNKLFQKFTLYELVVMAVMAALGIAIKPIVVPLAHIVCGPLMIPSGAFAGGLYMMWLVVGYGMVKKPGSALIISVVQALLVIFTGVIGSHGIMSLLTYILPGLAVELVMTISRHRGCCVGCCAVACIMANVTGTATVNIIFFQAPGPYLILILSLATFSGLAGGILGWQLLKSLEKFRQKHSASAAQHTWIEDVDDHLNCEREPAHQEQPPAKAKRKHRWIAVLAAVLVLAIGATALINQSQKSSDAGELSVLIDGEPVVSFTMKDIMKMDSRTEYVNLSSSSKDDAKGEFTGVTLETILDNAGLNMDNHSAVLITAGDGYSSAADEDELSTAIIAYELEGEPLGHYSDGGTGPLRCVFTEDTYGNRSVTNVVKLDLR